MARGRLDLSVGRCGELLALNGWKMALRGGNLPLDTGHKLGAPRVSDTCVLHVRAVHTVVT